MPCRGRTSTSTRGFGTPKTKRSVRTISLPQRCVRALSAHREQQERERKVAGVKWKPTPGQPAEIVFSTKSGGVTDPRGLNRMLTILCREARVRRVRVHDIRHTCASLLLVRLSPARPRRRRPDHHGDAGPQHDHDDAGHVRACDGSDPANCVRSKWTTCWASTNPKMIRRVRAQPRAPAPAAPEPHGTRS